MWRVLSRALWRIYRRWYTHIRCLTSSLFSLSPFPLSSSSRLLQWFGILNFLTLFVMLGIGADDIFVLLDVWKQSAQRYDKRGGGFHGFQRRTKRGPGVAARRG